MERNGSVWKELDQYRKNWISVERNGISMERNRSVWKEMDQSRKNWISIERIGSV